MDRKEEARQPQGLRDTPGHQGLFSPVTPSPASEGPPVLDLPFPWVWILGGVVIHWLSFFRIPGSRDFSVLKTRTTPRELGQVDHPTWEPCPGSVIAVQSPETSVVAVVRGQTYSHPERRGRMSPEEAVWLHQCLHLRTCLMKWDDYWYYFKEGSSLIKGKKMRLYTVHVMGSLKKFHLNRGLCHTW